jgi:hypothetical protein
MRRLNWITPLLFVLCVAGCVPEHPQDHKGTFASLATVDHRPWRGDNLFGRKYVFPTGARIVSRGDLANTAVNLTDASDAVVIQSDDVAYVALRGSGGPYPLTPSLARALDQRIRDVDPAVRYVRITTKPEAFADFAAFARHLTASRTVGGMLLTWRSVVQRAFGTQTVGSK